MERSRNVEENIDSYTIISAGNHGPRTGVLLLE